MTSRLNTSHSYCNSTSEVEFLTSDDAAWVLTSSFLILTMQTGFAMLECGCVSPKNVGNIMIKNVVDVTLGGLTYWMFGYGISFGENSNAFMGMGNWFVGATDTPMSGSIYTRYFFQFSFATTATTIVSGAVAERMELHAYMLFSLVNTVVYCFPASWAWNSTGFLLAHGFFDFAGGCVCHFCGGASALVAVAMVGSRLGRFEDPSKFEMSSPVTCLTGMFMLWWAWLGFNCGSTFGVTGNQWKIAAYVAVTTTNGAVGGGIAGISLSMMLNDKKVRVNDVVNSCLGGLVSITAIAPVVSPGEAIVVGFIGGTVAMYGSYLMVYFRLDDPVGAIPVHFFAAIWGTISVGIFGRNNFNLLARDAGILHGGSGKLLAAQLLGLACIGCWAMTLTFLFMLIIDKLVGIRMSVEHEILGADWVEHGLRSNKLALKLETAFKSLNDFERQRTIENILTEIKAEPIRQISGRMRVFATDSYDITGTSDRAEGLIGQVHSVMQQEAEKL